MPQMGRGLRWCLAIAAMAAFVAACGRSEEREAALTAAPVRAVVKQLAAAPQWQAGKCLCVGLFRGEGVEDFPPGVLAEEFSHHPWVRRWSECAPLYGRSKGLKECKNGMTDYICSVAERPDLPQGTTRVLCHINGENELLLDEYDVRDGEHGLEVHAVSSKASDKLHGR